MAAVNLGGGTISAPDMSQNLFIVSKVVRRHISKEDGYLKKDKDTELENLFDLDNFIQKELKTCFGSVGIGLGPCVYVQRRKRSSGPVPSAAQINIFLRRIFRKLSLNVECAIVALLYAERLMSQGKIAMNGRNWRPILLASILMASKMWDDLSSWNIEFSEVFPIFSLNQINMLEKLFLQEINYNLFISGTEYARYYFALRGLRYIDGYKIPRHYLDFQIGGRSLEERSRLVQAISDKKKRMYSPRVTTPDYGTSTPTRSMQIPVNPSSVGKSRLSKIPDFAESLREESLRVTRSLRRQQQRNGGSSQIGVFHKPGPPALILNKDVGAVVSTTLSNPQPIANTKSGRSRDQERKLVDPLIDDDNEYENGIENPDEEDDRLTLGRGNMDSNEFVVSLSPSRRSDNGDEELSRSSQSEEDALISLDKLDMYSIEHNDLGVNKTKN